MSGSIDTLWYTRCPVPTPLGLAAKLGWFDTEFAPDGIAHVNGDKHACARRGSHWIRRGRSTRINYSSR